MPVVIFIPICLFFNIGFKDIGFRLLGLNYNFWFNLITFIMVGVLAALFLYQIISFLVSEKYREAIKTKMINPDNKKQYDNVTNILIPCTIKEKKYLFLVALSAGICEEITFRGFFMYILQAL